jgi:pimeloyl-ACP methyl ester carboxylesterase
VLRIMANRVDTSVQYRTIHGHRRAFRLCGSGPVLLLIHGIGDSSEAWLPLIPKLAEHYTVLAPDLLGHGHSDKPRADYSAAAYANGMRDLLDVLGIDRATIVGHSLGGGVACQIVYQYPKRCDRLVLVAPGGVGREVTPLLRFLAAPYAELVLPPLRLPGAHQVARVVTTALGMTGTNLGRDAPEVLRVVDGLPRSESMFAFTRTLRSVVDWRGQVVTMLDRAYLAADVPLLIIWGDRDGVIPVAHAYRAHDALPGSQLEIFEGAGHFPFHHDPERFLRVFDEFMASTKPAVFDERRWRRRLRAGNAASSVTGVA